MVNAMAFSICDMDREIFQKAIQGIEDEMYRREVNGSRILTSVVCCLVLISIILTGCTTTIRGTGQAVKGVGQGIGTIVVGVGDFLIQEMEGK